MDDRRSMQEVLKALDHEARRLEVTIRHHRYRRNHALVRVLQSRWRSVQDRMILLEGRRP